MPPDDNWSHLFFPIHCVFINYQVIQDLRKNAGATSPKAPTVGSRLLSEWATEVAPTGFNTACFGG
jgi:hypothetical protein